MIVGIHFQLEIDANAWRARMGVVADLEREGLLVAGWAELRRTT